MANFVFPSTTLLQDATYRKIRQNDRGRGEVTRNTAHNVATSWTALTIRAEMRLPELPVPKMPMPANIWGAKNEICSMRI
jgi:hypothetical protein